MSGERPQRVQLSRRRGWRLPPNTVKVCRPTKWGNPFHIADLIDAHGGDERAARREAVAAYSRQALADTALRAAARAELRGKNLACWCPLDGPCHADLLIEFAND